MYRHVERVGRTCYKSEDKITPSSAYAFVQRMIDSMHYAMLEHGSIYLCIIPSSLRMYEHYFHKYTENPFSKVRVTRRSADNASTIIYVSTNYRVIVENKWEDDLVFLTNPTTLHDLRRTVKFTTSRQVTHELVRHRVFSFAQESTRYCNYTKGKFNSELTFISPSWELDPFQQQVFNETLQTIEDAYFALLDAWDNRTPDSRYKIGFRGNPLTPQQAASILPNSLKADIVLTGFTSDYTHLFDLRFKGTTGAPHPQMKEAMTPVYNLFVQNGFIHE